MLNNIHFWDVTKTLVTLTHSKSLEHTLTRFSWTSLYWPEKNHTL